MDMPHTSIYFRIQAPEGIIASAENLSRDPGEIGMSRSLVAKFLFFSVSLSLPMLQGLGSCLKAQGPEINLSNVNRVAFIGNSITLHGPKDDIDWHGNWGMAATEAERDYVHRLAKRLEEATKRKPQVSVRNLADFERGYDKYDLESGLAETVAFQPELVVVSLGENVPALDTDQKVESFEAAFQKLLQRLQSQSGNTPPQILVRGTFWRDDAKEGAMKRAAEKVKARFVSLEGLDQDPLNFGRSERPWKHAGVGGHPGDRGMERIAERIWGAISPSGKK
jgi:lysophospholipase L1-like esterase